MRTRGGGDDVTSAAVDAVVIVDVNVNVKNIIIIGFIAVGKDVVALVAVAIAVVGSYCILVGCGDVGGDIVVVAVVVVVGGGGGGGGGSSDIGVVGVGSSD